MNTDSTQDRLYKALCTLPPSAEYMDAFAAFDNPLQIISTNIDGARANANATFEDPIVDWFESDPPEEGTYRVEDHAIAVDGTEITARTLVPTPHGAEGRQKYPLLVFMHGGGFFAGSVRMEDHRLRHLCVDLKMSIVNVEYRLAPEHQYPVNLNDCYEALKWAVTNAELLCASPRHAGLIVGGTSAGGNLAAALTQRAVSDPFFVKNGIQITGQLLFMPTLLHPDVRPEEFKPYLDSRPTDLYRDEAITNMDLIHGCYDMHQGPPADPEVSPLLFPNRTSLPPLVIFVSGLDPLSEECLLYERLLRQAGVSTKVFVYAGVPHAHFLTFPGLKASAELFEDTKIGIRWLLRQQGLYMRHAIDAEQFQSHL
ncbi:uncharacterized protein STEHIDRAFT_168663 [Stereum hirsutum FP-91666 SS1]|uniref:uncharacterized protein n=1 Tax=Stereum hirsutum (strain FP-91666) TaxID=721885 RepID=UPI000440DC70|nr:uncharacterized protein STEHIDRAFT_168663 [Stereum hirsutum FP-91666 SS1]EIM86735.1 hypothetical protein STEHIDRAFT_168663 [Stereum hirsutum FP-91666 SS1]